MGGSQADPIRLYIRPDHLAQMGEPVHFTHARFSVGDGDEQAIVCRWARAIRLMRELLPAGMANRVSAATSIVHGCGAPSTGSYEVRWNFRRVKAGHLFDYRLLRHTDRIVADQFIYNQDRNVVVTLPDNVLVVNSASLRSPAKVAGGR